MYLRYVSNMCTLKLHLAIFSTVYCFACSTLDMVLLVLLIIPQAHDPTHFTFPHKELHTY